MLSIVKSTNAVLQRCVKVMLRDHKNEIISSERKLKQQM
jgi:hypothetical protein